MSHNAVAAEAATPLKENKEWQRTKKLIEDQLAENFRAMHRPGLSDQEVDRLHDNCQELLGRGKAHAVEGLKIIDSHMLPVDVANDIRARTKEAQAEAAKLKKVTATINELTGLVDQLSRLVGLFPRLI